MAKQRKIGPYKSRTLKVSQILAWARTHRDRHGDWPYSQSGRVVEAPDETWSGINAALTGNRRGLKGHKSLAKLLKKHGMVRARKGQPRLEPEDILRWADAFFAAHGYWPYSRSGSVEAAPGEDWRAIDRALRVGSRGLAGGSSLPDFLDAHRNLYQGRQMRPYRIADHRRIDMDKVMRWAKAYRRKTGIWPHLGSGEIPGSGGYRWGLVDMALRFGRRGLPGGTSLAKLFGPKKKEYPQRRKKRKQP